MFFTWSFNCVLSDIRGFGFGIFRLLLCLCLPLPVLGQVDPVFRGASSYRDSLYRVVSSSGLARISCHFVYSQGSSAVIPHLGDNSVELSRLDDFIREVLSTDSFSISRIRLTGYCSVEGEYTFNSQLARDRVEGFHTYLQAEYPSLYRYPVDLAWIPEDWHALTGLVRTSGVPNREEVLAILRGVSNPEIRKQNLRRLNGGKPYTYMLDNLFPQLRRVEITVEYNRQTSSKEGRQGVTVGAPDPLIYNVLNKKTTDYMSENARVIRVDKEQDGETIVTFTTPSLKEEQGTVSVTHRGVRHARRGKRGVAYPTTYRWAVKTNLLYWAGITPDAGRTTVMPNLAIEYFLSPRWSVEAGAKYSNRHYDHHRQFQGISGYRLEARYYLPLPPVYNRYVTPFLGVYGRLGDYNRVESGKLKVESYDAGGNTAQPTFNYTGKYWDAGFSAGFHLRLYRGLGLEFGARAGYVSAKPTVYHLHDDHNCYDYDTSYGKFRVTDLELGVVYRF